MNIPQQGTIMDHQDINFCIDYKMAMLLVACTSPRIHYPTSKTIQHLPNKSQHFRSLNQDHLIKLPCYQNNIQKNLHNYSSKTTIMVLPKYYLLVFHQHSSPFVLQKQAGHLGHLFSLVQGNSDSGMKEVSAPMMDKNAANSFLSNSSFPLNVFSKNITYYKMKGISKRHQ